MNRTIHKVAVLGSGIMGSRLACHFANCGMDVLLLDIPDPEPSKDANTLVNKALATAMASKPSRALSRKHLYPQSSPNTMPLLIYAISLNHGAS